MNTTCNTQIKEKCIYINFYEKLLRKLASKKLLTENGTQKNRKEYCEKDNYYEYEQEKIVFYSGKIIKELSELSNFEIAMLMASEDVISYDIRRNDRFFELIIYK